MSRPTTLVRVGALAMSGTYSAILFAVGLEMPAWASHAISALPTVAVGALLAWDLVLWRLPGIQALTRLPDLRGLWRVTLTPHPDSKMPPELRGETFEGFLEVTQSYWSLKTRMYTRESSSTSTAVTWLPSLESAVDNPTYIYENRPKVAVSHRSVRSTGSCTLAPASLKPTVIEGSYFTDRYAKGDMRLELVDRSKGYPDFEAARDHAEIR